MRLDRLFTTGSFQSEDLASFKTAEPMEEGRQEPLSVPEDWSLEAADAFRAALARNVPDAVSLVEENTVPSWLWRRRACTNANAAVENGVLAVFTRLVGAATYRGWKTGLWGDEGEASVFFDEALAALLSRRIVFSPEDMAVMGVDWAYGLPLMEVPGTNPAQQDALVLQNETIDAILRHGEPGARNKWRRFCEGSRSMDGARVVFADTMAEWDAMPYPACAPHAQINLMTLRTASGGIDVGGLEQAAKLAVLLMSLHEDVWSWAGDPAWPVALGFSNLAGLLMGLAIPYDSEAGRATAAALAAVMSGTATVTSAFLASRRGTCPAFVSRREGLLRTLRNRLRASFGEENDYEKIEIIPQTLKIDSGADLVLISAARRASEKAVELVQKHGLRHLQTTTLFEDPSFAVLAEASAQGVAAQGALVHEWACGDGTFARAVDPAVVMGLEKMNHDASSCEAVREYIVGARTLVGAPGVSQTALREKGFDEASLARVEAGLTRINHLKQAFTPWALGLDFCRDVLGIPQELIKDFRFDVLRHLGFSAREVSVASVFCCGHASVRGCLDLSEAERSVFATREDVSPEAQIKMASAVQPFVDGDAGLALAVPVAVVGEVRSEMFLMAWRMGLRNITLLRDGPLAMNVENPVQVYMAKRTAFGRAARPGAVLPRKRSALANNPVVDPSQTGSSGPSVRRKTAGKDKV